MRTTSLNARQQKRNFDRGLTLVELVIAIAVSSIIMIGLVSFIVTLTNQYAITSLRSNQTSSLVASNNHISRDVRASRSVLGQNAISDAAAPSNPGYWQSGSSQLVLAATARKTNGESLDGTYPGDTDNIIYYLRDGSLYRRLLAFNSGGGNRYTTITCTPLTGGGCPGDTKILDNVTAFTVTYYRKDGSVASPVTDAKRVAVSLEVAAQQSGQTISSTSRFTNTLILY